MTPECLNDVTFFNLKSICANNCLGLGSLHQTIKNTAPTIQHVLGSDGVMDGFTVQEEVITIMETHGGMGFRIANISIQGK